MKILFTHSYFLHFDEKQLEQSKPYPPLGTIQAASYMRSHNFEVELFDTNFSKSPEEIATRLDESRPDILAIYDDGFNYLTKMCLTKMRDAAFEMIRIAREKDIPAIISSSDSTDHYKAYLDAGADLVMLGEAEETMLELMHQFRDSGTMEDVTGTAYQKDGKITVTGRRDVITGLDKLPLPAWDLVDIKPYREAWNRHGYFSVNMTTSRGCPYQCNWCAKPIYGNKYNMRSPKHVVSEIKYIRTIFDYNHIWFCDDIFGLNPQWVKEFRDELKTENISIKYTIQSRADLLLQENAITYLADSGCDEVWIGAESGSQKVIDAMEKRITVANIEESTKLLKQHGIKPCFFLQLGYLTEEWEDIRMTLNMLFDLMPHDIGVSVSYPLPGTKFHDIVKSQLVKKANWKDSNELMLMYKNTYPPMFYKKLHLFIHKRFRQKQAFAELRKGNLSFIIRWTYFILTSHLLYLQVLLIKYKQTNET